MNKKQKSIRLKRLNAQNKLYKKTIVTKEVIVPGANLKDPIPKNVTNK